ncbi:MAG: hypothetical protein Q9222_001424 [Ikaeria aurantiellina]
MEPAQELNQLNGPAQHVVGTYTELSGSIKHRKDAVTLARLGKKQVLKSSYRGWPILLDLNLGSETLPTILELHRRLVDIAAELGLIYPHHAGADASVHMSEEIENAAANVPRAIFATMILNGSTGFGMALAVLFSIGDPEKVLATETGFPFIQVFFDGTQSKAGATVMTALVIALAWSAVIGFLATASRMVEHRSSIPIVAIILVTIIPGLLALIYIGSSTVFEDVVSLSVSSLYASYFVPCSLLLWCRTTGQVRERSSEDDSDEDIANSAFSSNGSLQTSNEAKQPTAQPTLVWGPWRVPGIFGTINNAFACIYIVFVLFWSFWPPATPATAENMNYSVLVTGFVITFSIVYYFVWGKKEYKGPLIDREVSGFARRDL